MSHTPLVPVLLILGGLTVLALLWRSLNRHGARVPWVRLDQLPAVLEQARLSLAAGAEIRAETVLAVQAALESFTRAFRSIPAAKVAVLPFPTAVRTPAWRRARPVPSSRRRV